MTDNDNEPDAPEVIRLNDEAALVDNDIKVEVYGAENGEGNYPAIIVAHGQSGIVGSEMNIRVSYGMPLPPEAVPEEPAQVATTESERAGIRQELRGLAQQIEELLRDYPLSPPPVAAAYFGIEVKGNDWSPVLERRRQWDQDLAAKYVNDVRPSVISIYQRARVRGFFDPELEKYYSSRLLVTAEIVPPMLRRLASREI
jgi:hypothetical protein